MRLKKIFVLIVSILLSCSCYPKDLSDELLDACKECDLNRCHTLISHGASVNVKSNDDGMTPLMYAVKCEKVELVDLILAHNPSLEEKDKEGKTALFIACDFRNIAFTEKLIDQGSQYTENIWGTSLLDLAVSGANVDMTLITILVEKFEMKSKMPDKLSNALFHTFSPQVMRYLISLGADVNHRNEIGDTPIYEAVRFPIFETTKFLIEHGADVNVKNENGWTPLLIAVYEGESDMVELLLSNGADWQPRMKKRPYKGLNAMGLAEKLTDKQFLEKIPPMPRQKYETSTFNEKNAEIIALLKKAGAKK